jgi:hypothetical protein
MIMGCFGNIFHLEIFGNPFRVSHVVQIQDRKEKWNRYQIVRKAFGIAKYEKISGGEKNLTSSHEPHMKI